VWSWPLIGVGGGPPAVVRSFQPPVRRWDSGHRGLDLVGAGNGGNLVRAASDGVVAFAGPLFGRGVVSIGTGGVRTSYEPVTPTVRAGEQVVRGEVIGTLQNGHCAGEPCLHWGLLAGHGKQIRYYDPAILLGPAQVRLEPVRNR
jgi:murein DD-endopeptidase MepM/ murein hydrolase activator NlpD